jgi:hypothetical protein
MTRVREDGQTAERSAGQALQASTSAVSYRGRDRRGREKTHLALLSKLVEHQAAAKSVVATALSRARARRAVGFDRLVVHQRLGEMAPETSAETLARALAMKATHHFRDQPDAHDFQQAGAENPIDSCSWRTVGTSAREC